MESFDAPMEPELQPFRVTPESYADRKGYDPGFLGVNFEVPLPGLGAHETDAVEVDGAPSGSPYELRYTRFSVVMSKSRRFSRVTAVNIAGEEPFFKVKRARWRTEPRIGTDDQVGDEDLYGPTTFSRGHMVRRQDPLWGDPETAKRANGDTFHLTNACPQVQSFNDGLWGNLEDHILAEGDNRDSRITVFTGPILRDDDPEYFGIKVPVSFYKIIVTLNDSSNVLLAAAFVQSQEDLLPRPAGVPVPFAGFNPGAFRPYQIRLVDLEARTGLDFGALREHDALSVTHEFPQFGLEGVPIRAAADIVFSRSGVEV